MGFDSRSSLAQVRVDLTASLSFSFSFSFLRLFLTLSTSISLSWPLCCSPSDSDNTTRIFFLVFSFTSSCSTFLFFFFSTGWSTSISLLGSTVKTGSTCSESSMLSSSVLGGGDKGELMITDSSCLISRFGDETVRTGVGVLVGGRWTVGRGGVCLMVVTGARGNT